MAVVEEVKVAKANNAKNLRRSRNTGKSQKQQQQNSQTQYLSKQGRQWAPGAAADTRTTKANSVANSNSSRSGWALVCFLRKRQDWWCRKMCFFFFFSFFLSFFLPPVVYVNDLGFVTWVAFWQNYTPNAIDSCAPVNHRTSPHLTSPHYICSPKTPKSLRAHQAAFHLSPLPP